MDREAELKALSAVRSGALLGQRINDYMKEYQARSADMKSIMCQWPEWDRNRAIETYRREYANAPTTDLRHGKVLVLAEWESPQEADRARLDWMQEFGEPAGFFFDTRKSEWRDDKGDCAVKLRDAIDSARRAPESKVTVIERPN